MIRNRDITACGVSDSALFLLCVYYVFHISVILWHAFACYIKCLCCYMSIDILQYVMANVTSIPRSRFEINAKYL